MTAMTIRELKTGNIFRFPKGNSLYIMLICEYTNEIGWLIKFANIQNGQKYTYTEKSFFSKEKCPTLSNVILLGTSNINHDILDNSLKITLSKTSITK